MYQLTPLESLKSLSNSFWFSLRKLIRFRRAGYSEESPSDLKFVPEAQDYNLRYEFHEIGQKLFPRHWIRNLSTLWVLEQMLAGEAFSQEMTVLEPCCQDFVRLPAMRAFFKTKTQARITGIEIDAFVPLSGFHSRWDHAQYYVGLQKDNSRYVDADFFNFKDPADLIICFYPFISASPALAWGLPAAVANASRWIKSFEDNLRPGGRLLVVHQGEWEEKDFDLARQGSSLKVLLRKPLICPFFPTKHPMHATLYSV